MAEKTIFPREEKADVLFNKILNDPWACEKLQGTFCNSLFCNEDNNFPLSPAEFSQALFNAYHNRDLSAFLMAICQNTLFDLLRNSFLIPYRFNADGRTNPIIMTDESGNLLPGYKTTVHEKNYQHFYDVYCDLDNKKNIYKILKEEDFGKLQDKSLKLDLLEEKKDATNISIPKLKIENNIFVGVIEDYIDGYDLCDINLNCKDINEIMNILIKVSMELKKIHEENIVISDLNARNIRIDKSGTPYFLDCLSYSIGKYKSDVISRILLSYLVEHDIYPETITKEMDKISFMMLVFNLIFDKKFYYITYNEYESKIESIKYLGALQNYFEMLRTRKKQIDMPYLHEIISDCDVKKFKKEMR